MNVFHQMMHTQWYSCHKVPTSHCMCTYQHLLLCVHLLCRPVKVPYAWRPLACQVHHMPAVNTAPMKELSVINVSFNLVGVVVRNVISLLTVLLVKVILCGDGGLPQLHLLPY